jgi:dCTP deaminase
MLPDWEILAALESGELGIDPFDPAMVQPASVDVRLADTFRIIDTQRHAVIDPLDVPADLTWGVVPPYGQPWHIESGEFMLASTMETVTLGSKLAARFEGRSSLGRLGLLTHVTAGFIDPGFKGSITVELVNLSPLPIKLTPGMSIGQLCFYRLTSPCRRSYGSPGVGRYQGQSGPTASRGVAQ